MLGVVEFQPVFFRVRDDGFFDLITSDLLIMLFDLPSDLSISILTDWLDDLKPIVALEVAAAKSARSAYRSILAHPSFFLRAPLVIMRPSSPKLVSWISSCSVKICALQVEVSKTLQVSEISSHCLAPIRKLQITTDHCDHCATHSDCLRKLFVLLPSLTELDLSEFIPRNCRAYLLVLAQSGLPLRTICLDDDTNHCNGIDVFINAYGATLESICFGSMRNIDAATLDLISSTCHQVSTLHFAYSADSTADLIAALGSSRLPHLRNCQVDNGRDFGVSKKPAVNDEFAVAVFKHHPNLLSFNTKRHFHVSIAVCADALLLCPGLENFRSNELSFIVGVDKSSSVGKSVDLSFHIQRNFSRVLDEQNSHKVAANLRTILSACKYPVTSLSCPELLFTNNDFCDVLSAIGKSLRTLDCRFSNRADDDDTIVHLSLTCPQLKLLHLNKCAVSDTGLKALADHCRHLTDFRLYAAEHFSDFGMCYLVDMLGERLTKLCLYRCKGVTAATLVAVVASCAELKEFDTAETSIISEDIKDHLIAPNRLSCLKTLVVM